MLPKKLVSGARELIAGMRAWEEDSEVIVMTGFANQGPLSIFSQMDQNNKYVIRAYAEPVGRGIFGIKYKYLAEVFDYVPDQIAFGQQLLETTSDNPKSLWDAVIDCIFSQAIERNKRSPPT